MELPGSLEEASGLAGRLENLSRADLRRLQKLAPTTFRGVQDLSNTTPRTRIFVPGQLKKYVLQEYETAWAEIRDGVPDENWTRPVRQGKGGGGTKEEGGRGHTTLKIQQPEPEGWGTKSKATRAKAERKGKNSKRRFPFAC